MKKNKRDEVYIVFSGGTEEERKSLKDAVYNEIVIDKDVIFEKKRQEVPDDVKGILGIPPPLLDPAVILLIAKLLPGVIWGIIKLIKLIGQRKGTFSEKVEVTMVYTEKKTKIKFKKMTKKS